MQVYAMKLKDLLIDPNNLETYSPPRHAETVNHRLWPQTDGPAPIEVIHGFLGPNGGAEAHYHAESDQMIYMLSGIMRLEGQKDSVELHKGQFIFLPKGLEHRVHILNPEGVKCIVMYMPRLNSDDILPAKGLGKAASMETISEQL